jgi:hypothetical protein
MRETPKTALPTLLRRYPTGTLREPLRGTPVPLCRRQSAQGGEPPQAAALGTRPPDWVTADANTNVLASTFVFDTLRERKIQN